MQIIKGTQINPLPDAGKQWTRLDGTKITMPTDEAVRLAICVADGWSEYTAPALTPAEIAAQLEDDRKVMQERVRSVRADAHDRIQKRSVGVSTIYRVNLEAAQKYLASDTSAMPDGKTPEQYLAFGARLGMAPAQFATWIVSENLRLGPGAWDVEDQYLATRVAVATSNDPAVWESVAATYEAFCATIESE